MNGDRHPEAEAFLVKRLEPFVAEMPPLQAFAVQLYQRASGRLIDWLDHLVLADGEAVRGELAELGFEAEEAPADPGDVGVPASGGDTATGCAARVDGRPHG